MKSFIPGSSASICVSFLTICMSCAKPGPLIAKTASKIVSKPNSEYFIRHILASPLIMRFSLFRSRSPRRNCLNATFVTPCEHVKLRQHSNFKPSVLDSSRDEPPQSARKVSKIGGLRKRARDRQRRRIADLKIRSELRIARRHCSRVGVVHLIEDNDFESTLGSCSRSCQTFIESGPIGRHPG